MDPSFQLLAARYLRKQARQLGRQLDGVRRGEQTEFIHQARVASRRLRAALRMFAECFPAASVARWQKEIRKLTKGLGKARDKDVQVEFLCGVLHSLQDKAHYPGIARLMVKLERKRESLQAKVVAAVDRLEASKALDEMKAAMKSVVAEMRRRRVPIHSEMVGGRTEAFITSAMDELLQYQASLNDPQDIERHHAMRIAAKQLRYTMEICKPAYDGRLNEAIATVKQLQTLLGDLHDCDVWVDHLAKLLDKERKRVLRCYGHEGPLARLEAGIAWLQNDRRCRREQLFVDLVALWQELDRKNFWDDLLTTVQCHEVVTDNQDQPQERDKGGEAAEVAEIGHGA